MKYIILLVMLVALFYSNGSAFPSEIPMYHAVRITLSPGFSLRDAEEYGIELEHATIKQGAWIETVLSDMSLKRLRSNGVEVSIQIENLKEFYRARNSASLPRKSEKLLSQPKNFSLGSFGGYFTLKEIYAAFDSMHTFAPDIVSSPLEIGSTFEKRPLHAYRFGRNLSDTMPEVLFTSLHHAREPGSASTLIYFLWKLLEDAAAGNAEATYLLENRVWYVIPVVNPDGYAYNERNGYGSLWRKNRNDNKDGTFGVDLNRNYGPLQFWNASEGGSSEKSHEDTYRGSAPFSELETQAIRDFVYKHNFKMCINYHTFSNVLIYPFGFGNIETPDSAFFRAFSADASKFNKYSAGRDIQTVGYTTRGVSDDWLYTIDSAKNRTYSFTSEVGSRLDGFYAPKERIIPQCEDNLYFNLQTLWSAGSNYRIIDAVMSPAPQNTTSQLIVKVQNTGVATPVSTYSLTLNSLDSRLTITDNIRNLQVLSPAQSVSIAFDARVQENYPNGDRSLVEAIILQDGVERRDTLKFLFSRPKTTVLYGSASTDSLWQKDTWGILPNPEGGYMLTDSPTGNYEDSTSNYLQLKSPIDVISARSVSLEFWTKWSIESNFDFAIVQVSDNDGRSWEYLQTNRMKPSSKVKGSRQAQDSYGFDGNFPTWVRQECSLNDFIGKKILLRFGVLSDARSNFDGMFLRDIAIKTYDDTMGGITNEPVQNTTLEVFPTPTERGKLLYAVLSKPKEQLPERAYQLFLYNMLGEQCYQQSGTTISGNEHVFSIPTSLLSTGAYQLSIEYDGQRYTSGIQIMK